MRIDDENRVVWCSQEMLDWYESFETSDVKKDLLVYYISRLGWGYTLTDGVGKRIKSKFYTDIDKLSLIKAIIDDYEFKLKQPKKYYWRKKKEYLSWFENHDEQFLVKLGGEVFLDDISCVSPEFTEQEARELLKNDFNKFERVEVY